MGDTYSGLGVDARKGGFGRRMTAVSKDNFPYAFCKMYEDPDTGLIVCQHGDGVGSKSIQRYLHWRETGDSSVFGGDVDDCVEMNLGDIACSGLDPVMLTDNIAINKSRVPKEVYMDAINQRFAELMEFYAEHGMGFTFAGGETADLPDQVGTYVFDGTVYARAPREKIVTCEKISPGDIIMGLRSGGSCDIEGGPNSGIMSNGLTMARHVLMHPDYAGKYPEIKDTSRDDNTYTGRFRVDDRPGDLGMSVSEAIISPTRHFSIIVHELLRRYGDEIHGIVLNTGGGQTKCTRVGRGIRYVKDGLPMPDEIFRLIQSETGEGWENMYQDFNMGIGLDVIGPQEMQGHVMELADEFGVGSMRTGYCDESKEKRGGNPVNQLVITNSPWTLGEEADSDLEYQAE